MKSRDFPIGLRSIRMDERIWMVKEFGVNWDVVEVDLAEIADLGIEDKETATTRQKLDAARIFAQAIGPVEKLALLAIAVRRVLPTASVKDIKEHAFADGETTERWQLALVQDTTSEEDDADPLPPTNSNDDGS